MLLNLRKEIEDVTLASFRQQFNVNVLGSILAIQASVKLFGNKGGNIINISSEVSKTPLATGAVYSATKAALDAITISLSREFGGKNIRINSILPGVVETEGSHAAGFIGSDAETKLVATTPLGRTGQLDDIAKVAVFHAYDELGWITGGKSPYQEEFPVCEALVVHKNRVLFGSEIKRHPRT